MLPSPPLQAAHGQPVVESCYALEALLRQRQVSMHFQPIVSSNGREVFAYEALARGNAAGPLASPLAMFRRRANTAGWWNSTACVASVRSSNGRRWA